MIRCAADDSASSVERTLGSSNLVLFFSLPFKPPGRRNLLFNGHIALVLEGTMYQVYDPKLLKSDFLFSEMPALDWLFGDGGYWVGRDPRSPQFKHVYLYRTCESRRTVVYYAGIRVNPSLVKDIRERFSDEENRFKRGDFAFSIFSNNCSSIIASALNGVTLIEPSFLNCIPLRLFKRFVGRCAAHSDVEVGKVAMCGNFAFELHRFCIGAGVTNPEKAMDRWLLRRTADSRSMDVP